MQESHNQTQGSELHSIRHVPRKRKASFPGQITRRRKSQKAHLANCQTARKQARLPRLHRAANRSACAEAAQTMPIASLGNMVIALTIAASLAITSIIGATSAFAPEEPRGASTGNARQVFGGTGIEEAVSAERGDCGNPPRATGADFLPPEPKPEFITAALAHGTKAMTNSTHAFHGELYANAGEAIAPWLWAAALLVIAGTGIGAITHYRNCKAAAEEIVIPRGTGR